MPSRSLPALQQAKDVLSDCRMRAPGGNTNELLQVAAHLYQLQGRYEMALAIYLKQREAAVFDFIAEHGLLRLLGDYVPQLMAIDEVRATQLLVEQQYEVPPQVVVAKLQVVLHDMLRSGVVC